jgi:hypothetical protein
MLLIAMAIPAGSAAGARERHGSAPGDEARRKLKATLPALFRP